MSTDLELVSECLRGSESAWEEFLHRHRARILAFALTLSREAAAAEEITSAVCADIYGIRVDANGVRGSKLASYSGRGSFEGWLRTLVLQAYVERHRRERRFVPLAECAECGSEERAVEIADVRLEQALHEALGELKAEQRLVLAAHYLDGRTFAEIGRMTGRHESSVSRVCSKSVAFVRRRTVHFLRAAGMSLDEAQEAMKSDVRAISLDVGKRLQLAKNTS